MNILIICISIVICYGMYLFYIWKNPYVEDIVESNDIGDLQGNVKRKALLIKRIYKNGRTTYINKTYK